MLESSWSHEFNHVSHWFQFFLVWKALFESLKTLEIQSWHLSIQGTMVQFNHSISFVWSLAMQINHKNMSNAYELRDTVLNYKCKPWDGMPRFLELWCLNLIANHSWYLLQCVWMDKAPWIGLECKNKFWVFLKILEIGMAVLQSFSRELGYGWLACI